MIVCQFQLNFFLCYQLLLSLTHVRFLFITASSLIRASFSDFNDAIVSSFLYSTSLMLVFSCYRSCMTWVCTLFLTSSDLIILLYSSFFSFISSNFLLCRIGDVIDWSALALTMKLSIVLLNALFSSIKLTFFSIKSAYTCTEGSGIF